MPTYKRHCIVGRHINIPSITFKHILYNLLSCRRCDFVINPFPASQISSLKYFSNCSGYCRISLCHIQVQELPQPNSKLFTGTFGNFCALHPLWHGKQCPRFVVSVLQPIMAFYIYRFYDRHMVYEAFPVCAPTCTPKC